MKTKLLLALLFGTFICVEGMSQGQLWLLARDGGIYNGGTILSMNPGNTSVTVHHAFQSPAGFTPYGNLLQADDGNLYGTCYNGGLFGSCTLFKLDPSTNAYDD